MTARLRSLPAMSFCSLRLFTLVAFLRAMGHPLMADPFVEEWDPFQIHAESPAERPPLLAAPRLNRPWDDVVHPLLEGRPVLPPGHDTTLLAPRLQVRTLHFEGGWPPRVNVMPFKLEQRVLEPLIFDWLAFDSDRKSEGEKTPQQLQKEGYEAFREDVKYPDETQDAKEEVAVPGSTVQPHARRDTHVPLTEDQREVLKGKPGKSWLSPRMEQPEDSDPAPVPGAAKSPPSSRLSLEGHLAMKEGHVQEGRRDFDGAYFKFKEARDLFDGAHQTDPAWQPEIVAYRRKKIREDMERVRRAEIQHRAGQGTAAPAPPGVEINPRHQPDSPDQKSAPLPPRSPDEKVRPDQPLQKGEQGRPQEKRQRKTLKPRPQDRKDLRLRLQEAEAALQESRRREEALRTVVRDLIQQMDAPHRHRPAFRHPPLQPPFPPSPPPPPSTPPVPPSSAP